jgi:hypothetical protein
MCIKYFDYSFIQVRNLLLLLRGLRSNSSSDGAIGLRKSSSAFGLLPQTHTGNSGGHVQPSHHFAMVFLTILSSSEWNVITDSLPSGARQSNAD